MTEYADLRDRMVDVQLARRGIRDSRVLDAMRRVPRERFLEAGFEEFAYEDGALPIASGQTISQPYIVAAMTEAAELKPADKVLEVGTGSGTGDGTRGLPDEAPFDAILVTAGGPSVPDALKRQLAVAGRLVIPVGTFEDKQSLLRITRRTATEYDEETFGAVRFVPLIGEQGWAENGTRSASNHAAGHVRAQSVTDMIRAAIEPLPAFEDPAFGTLFDRLGRSRVVLLGEASHGTSEFYQARAAITRRLIEKHGFTIVAVEADWPDAAAIDRYVRGRDHAGPQQTPFERFPIWMWRNTDVAAFVDWMRSHNEQKLPSDPAGFFGLDILQHARLDRGCSRVSRQR